MRTRILLAFGLLALLPAVAGAWGHEPGPPPGTVTVNELGGFEAWPYTGSDFSGEPYDPVNLLLPDVDPREVRQALLSLDGERELPPVLLFGGCIWADAMGSEQVAWAETDGWVGGEVQLVCIEPSAPLGDPFRVHLRLYREGDVTLGAAHFEILIPGTAQHEVLSWDFARFFVALDMARSGLLADPDPVGLQTPGTFRAVRRPIYDALLGMGAEDLLAFLGLFPPPPAGDVPIPTDGTAIVLAGDIPLDPVQEKIRTQIDVPWNVVVPRPFCSEGAPPLVHLQGSLRLTLVVHTNPSGKYGRVHRIWGTLYVTPGVPDPVVGFVPTGPPEPVDVREYHRALLTDRYGQLREVGSQDLQGAVPQSLWWRLDAGQRDRYREVETCAP